MSDHPSPYNPADPQNAFLSPETRTYLHQCTALVGERRHRSRTDGRRYIIGPKEKARILGRAAEKAIVGVILAKYPALYIEDSQKILSKYATPEKSSPSPGSDA